MTIPLKSIVDGTSVNCTVQVAPITAADGATALDTLIVRVVDDSITPSPVDSPVQLTLLVDDQIAKTMTRTDTTESAPTTGGLAHTFAVKARGRDTPSICVAGAAAEEADSVIKRLREEDNQRKAKSALVGDSWVILSLIKSVSGRIPANEFFDLRMKFGGEVLPAPKAPIDSDALAIANAKSIAVKRIRDAGADTAKRRVAVADAKRLATARTFQDSAEAADWRRDVPFRLRHQRLVHAAASTKQFVGRRFATSRVFTMGNIDLSLNTTADTAQGDSSKARKEPEVTDAGFSINYIASPVSRSDRMGFAYGQLKIFNAKSYYGGGYGGLELRGSRLEGTMVTVSYLHRMYRDSTSVAEKTTSGADTTVMRELANTHNILVEFFIRVPDVQILANLRVRGGLLYPLGAVPAGSVRPPIESRVSVSVPIVDLQRF